MARSRHAEEAALVTKGYGVMEKAKMMDSMKSVEPVEYKARADIAVTEGVGVKDKVKEMESPKRVAESWKSDGAKPGQLPAAPDLAAAGEDEAPMDTQLAVEIPSSEQPATENKDVAAKSREVLDSSKVIEQVEMSPSSSATPASPRASWQQHEAQAQRAAECGCVIM
jgi:hypothetical protein